MADAKRCVYVLKSTLDPTRYDTGVTANVRTRLIAHNKNRCLHTSRWKPWRIIVVVTFASEQRALDVERT